MKKKIILIVIIAIIAASIVMFVLHEKTSSDLITDITFDKNSSIVNSVDETEKNIDNNNSDENITVANTINTSTKKDDILTVKVSMDDSGLIKSMALSIKFDENSFELLDGKWINHNAVLSDFNKENMDAVISFADEENFYGEIFEFRLRVKKDMTFSLDDIRVNPILKNGVDDIVCKGIVLATV